MAAVRCSDCGTPVDLPVNVRSGDVLECPNCAGHLLRIHCVDGTWAATIAHRVSCPDCDQMLTLPDDAKPGDLVNCCGRDYRLTFEYGAFAAEER